MKKLLLTAIALAALLSSCNRPGESAPETPVEQAAPAATLAQALPEAATAEMFSFPALPEATTAPAAPPASTAEAASLPAVTQTSALAQSAAKLASTVSATTKTSAVTKLTTTRYVYINDTTAKSTAASTAQSTTTSTAASPAAANVFVQPPAATKPVQETVSFTIDGSAAVSYGYNVFLPAQAMALGSGDSVLDLLGRSGAAVQARGSGMTAYVVAIGGLAEKDCGGTSGWVYEVNGVRPNMSCGRYQPKNGDVIVWRYSLTP